MTEELDWRGIAEGLKEALDHQNARVWELEAEIRQLRTEKQRMLGPTPARAKQEAEFRRSVEAEYDRRLVDGEDEATARAWRQAELASFYKRAITQP